MAYTNYQKGRNFEYRVKKYLEEKGFFVVRSAGSHGIFDLIAVETYGEPDDYSEHLVYGIQCRVDGKTKKEEVEKMKEIYWKYGIIPIIAYREGKKLVFKHVVLDAIVIM